MNSKVQRNLFDQFDCACSSLLLNCGQFGCCIANVAEHEYGIDNCHQWMTQLASVRPDALLRDLVIPGTHDSASYSISKIHPFSAVGRTQNCTIYQQLQRGVRYLDIRVAGRGEAPESVYIHHGALVGCPLIDVLDDVVRFMDENPGEFVFLHIVQEYGRTMTPKQRIYTFDLLQTTFGNKLYMGRDWSRLITGMALDDIVNKSSTRCVVLLHNRILDGETDWENYILEKYGYFNSSRCMFDKWHNTRSIQQLFEWNVDEERRHGDNKRKLLCNQLLLTPGVGGIEDVLRLLIGFSSLRPITFASALYKRDALDNFCRQHADQKWNLLKLDFCDLIPALMSFLVSLNFPTQLTILTAAVVQGGSSNNDSIDVTSILQVQVKRDKVLYLTNVRDDLGLGFEEGTLTVAYRMGRNSHHVFEVEFDDATEIVLSEFTHNEGGVIAHVDQTEKDISRTQQEGVFHRGRILSKEEYSTQSVKSGTAFGYSKNSDTNEVDFQILHY